MGEVFADLNCNLSLKFVACPKAIMPYKDYTLSDYSKFALFPFSHYISKTPAD
jgi:hypothetical protein